MANTEPNEELADLLRTISEDRLTPEQHRRLEAILRHDPEARKIYLQYVRADALLAWRFAPVPGLPLGLDPGVDVSQINATRPDRARGTRRGSAWRHALNVAAIFLVGLVLGLPLGSTLNRSVPDDRRAPAPNNSAPDARRAPALNGQAIAVLASVSDDVIWNKENSMPRMPGSELGKGWIQIDAGTIELKFESGATVQLEGPAAFGIDSAMRGYLERGRCRVHAPKEARDFVVATAAMEVVDLGTRFAMSVDEDSNVKVNVLEGLVDLHVRGESTQYRIQSLLGGQMANVDAAGRIIGIKGDPSIPKNQLRSGLLAHWRLDNLDATGHVADTSGNGLDGELRGDAIACPGKVGGAFDLTRGGYIDLGAHIPALTSTRAFTIAAWVRDAKNMVFSVSDGTPQNRVQFEVSSNSLLYGWGKGPQFDKIEGAVGWEAGRWYHVAVSVSGGVVTLYRDGRMVNSPTSKGMLISTPSLMPIDIDKPTHAYIGYLIVNHKNKSQSLGGKIDDVQFYGYALDEQAIRYLYEHPGETYRDASLNR